MTTSFCGSCGTARGSADQRFCKSCGTPYGAPATPAAETSAFAAPSAADSPSPYQPASGPDAGYTQPSWVQQDAAPADYALPADVDQTLTGQPRPKRRVGRLLGVGALVLAVGGAGVVGWQVFGPKGGAGSPEDAVSTLMSAVADQDGVALLSVINPGEVAGLDDVYESARKRLDDEGLISGAELSGAVDIDFENLEFDVEELGDGVSRVTLAGGTMTASYDPDQLPDRLAFVADEFPDAESEEIDLAKVLDEANDYEDCQYDEDNNYEEYDCTVEESGFELGLTVVEIDGRWYVSLLGTVADLYYQEVSDYYDDVRRPDYDATAAEVDPVVGKDPEEVVAHLVDAINDNDVDGLLAQLPEDLGVGLRPYARTIEKALGDGSVSASVTQDDLDLDTEDLGDDLVKVTINDASFSADASAEGESVSGSVKLYDACLEATGQEYDEEYGEYYEDSANGCLPDQILEDAGIDRPFIVLRKVDDGYQLDPAATVSVYASTIVEKAPSSLIDEAVDAIESGDDSFFECYVGDYCEN